MKDINIEDFRELLKNEGMEWECDYGDDNGNNRLVYWLGVVDGAYTTQLTSTDCDAEFRVFVGQDVIEGYLEGHLGDDGEVLDYSWERAVLDFEDSEDFEKVLAEMGGLIRAWVDDGEPLGEYYHSQAWI